MNYPFWLGYVGQSRLLLHYWNGASPDMDCDQPPANAQQAESSAFSTNLLGLLE